MGLYGIAAWIFLCQKSSQSKVCLFFTSMLVLCMAKRNNFMAGSNDFYCLKQERSWQIGSSLFATAIYLVLSSSKVRKLAQVKRHHGTWLMPFALKLSWIVHLRATLSTKSNDRAPSRDSRHGVF